MENNKNKVSILSSEEFRAKLKGLKFSKDFKVGGYDPSKSKPFDDYVFKLIGSSNKNLSEFFESGATLTDKEITEIIDARSESIFKVLLNDQSFNAGNEVAKKEALDIPEDYSFDDVPANKLALSILDQARVDFESDKFDDLPSVIEIDNKVFGTLGNFSMIIGKPKSGKTFLSTLLAAAAINGQDDSKLLTIKLPGNKSKVVIIDTEQSTYHTSHIGKRLKELIVDYIPGQFDLFSLRKFPIEQRLQGLEELFKRYNDVGLVIIDGIKDLVSEVNSEKEATQISNKLLEWTQSFDTHIVVVLHQNKGDSSARGHLGAELQNKAETTVSITKRKDVSIVQPEYTRNEAFAPFAIGLKPIKIGKKETVIPFINTDFNFSTKTNGKGKISITPVSTSVETHQKILNELNERCLNKQIIKGEAKDMIKEIAEKYQLKFGSSKAQEFLVYYQEKKWIQMIKPNGKGRPIVSVEINSIK